MQSTVDASTAICESPRAKRVASPALPSVSACDAETHQPLPQHGPSYPIDQTCSCKRQRTSSQYSSLDAQNSSASARTPSNIQHDTQNEEFKVTGEMRKINHEATTSQDATSTMMAMAATALKSTQDSSQGSGLTASASDKKIRDLRNLLRGDETVKARERMSGRLPSQTEEMDAFTKHRTEVNESRSVTSNGLVGPQQRSLNNSSTGNSTIHNFYTKAAILSPRGIFDFVRVQVDERCSFNLLPWSIAKDLHLILYSDMLSTITIADRLIHTNQYCRFTIRVAGVDMTINAMVIHGLQIVLLGKEWIQSVRLLNGFDNQSYYIPVPLAVEAAEDRLPDIRDADIKSPDVEMSMIDDTGENRDDEECDDTSCRDDNSSNSELSFNRHPSDDELSLDNGLLPNSEVSSGKELTFDAHGLTPIDEADEDDEDDEGDEGDEDGEDDEDDDGDDSDEVDEGDDGDDGDDGDEDDEDYGSYEGEEFEECEECKCEECEECEGCEKYEGYEVAEYDSDANLQGFMEQNKHHEYYIEAQPSKSARETHKIEPEPQPHHLTSFAGLKNSLGRNNESIQDPAFNISSQMSGPKGEQAFTHSRHVDNLDQSASPDSTTFQRDGVQTPFTKSQAKKIANTLNDIRRTQAGQSFKAPVEQLWPECAEVYAVKVPNPIDLGTMEMKVKNNMYHSLDEFRADSVLLYENSVVFNGIDHIITSAALEVRDTILKAISDIEEGKSNTTLRASIRKP